MHACRLNSPCYLFERSPFPHQDSNIKKGRRRKSFSPFLHVPVLQGRVLLSYKRLTISPIFLKLERGIPCIQSLLSRLRGKLQVGCFPIKIKMNITQIHKPHWTCSAIILSNLDNNKNEQNKPSPRKMFLCNPTIIFYPDFPPKGSVQCTWWFSTHPLFYPLNNPGRWVSLRETGRGTDLMSCVAKWKFEPRSPQS